MAVLRINPGVQFMSNTHEHLEHAEHAEHAAHDPFGARVALSIAVIAAILAAVTLLSHQAHNTTLEKRVEAGELRTEAADQWGFFQAKKIRQHEDKLHHDLLLVVSKENGKNTEAEEQRRLSKEEADRYEHDCEEIKEKAKVFEDDAKKATEASHLAHARGGRYDLSELAVELGLVLCSIAVLTKRRTFWYSGLGAAAVGLILALSALTVSVPHHEEGHASVRVETPEQHAA
jgi:Domain of unknown function (DUF4337)